MESDFQLLSSPTAANRISAETAKAPKYLNGHRLPEKLCKELSKEKLGVPLQEIDPYYKNDKTFVVIAPGTRILHRYDGADTQLDQSGGWRSQAIGIVSHGIFNHTMTFVVLLNCILMAFYPLKVPSNKSGESNGDLLAELAEIAFLVIYIIECGLKILARGLYKFHWKFSYLNISWSWLDIFIIVTGVLMAATIKSNLLYSCLGFRILKLIPLNPDLFAVWENIICRLVSKLRPLLFYVTVIMYMLALLGMQLFFRATDRRCVKQFDPDTTTQSWEQFIQNPSNWWTGNGNGSLFQLCGNDSSAQRCPSNYTCLFIATSPQQSYILFDTIYWSELQTIQIVFQDFKESISEVIWATTGFIPTFVYLLICFFIGTFSIGTFVYAIIGAELESIFSKLNKESCETLPVLPEPVREWRFTKLRQAANVVVNHKIFEIVITTVIVLDIITAGMEEFEMRDTMNQTLWRALGVFNMFTQGIYTIEFIIKFTAFGLRGYFREGRNLLDFLVVLMFAFHLFEVGFLFPLLQLRVLKLFPRWSSLGFIFKIMFNSRSFISIHNCILSLLGILLFSSSIFGYTNFTDDYAKVSENIKQTSLGRWNFVDVWHSIKVIFRIFCGEWIEVLWDLFAVSDYFLPIVCILTTVLCSNFLITSLGITIILTTKSELEKNETKPPTPFEQIFYPITWVYSKIPFSIFCEDSEATKQNGDGDLEAHPNQEQPTQDSSPLQQKLSKIIEHGLFTALTIVILLVTSFSLAKPGNAAETALDIVFFLYFVTEIAARFVAYRISKRVLSLWLLLDVLILLDTFLTLVTADTQNIRGFICLRSFRILMLIPRVQRIKVVLHGLYAQFRFLFKYILAVVYLWFTFTLIGISLFMGSFHKCLDSHGEEVHMDIAHLNPHCFTGNATWNPSATNFDNVLEGFWTLSQVVTFNGWLHSVKNAEDSSGAHLLPKIEGYPATFLFFVAFVIFGVLYPLYILFGLLLSYFRKEGRHRILSTPAQLKIIQTSNDADEQDNDIIAPEPGNGNGCSQKINAFVNHHWFQLGVCGVIFLNTLLIALDYPDMSNQMIYYLELAHALIGLIYLVEMILKLIAWRHYFTKWWNIMDFFVVLFSVLEFMLVELGIDHSSTYGTLRIFRLIHFLRLTRIFTIELGTLGHFRKALGISFPILLNILYFYCTIFFSYALLGMALFKNTSPTQEYKELKPNFQDFQGSLMALFLIVTLSGWEGIYENAIRNQRGNCDKTGKCDHTALGLVYVFSFMAITFLVAVNLYLTLGLEIIEQLNQNNSKKNEIENEANSGDGDEELRIPEGRRNHTVDSKWDDGVNMTA